MNSVCTNSSGRGGGGSTKGGLPRNGHESHLISTSVGVVPLVGGGDVRVVGKGDVVEDVGGQLSS